MEWTKPAMVMGTPPAPREGHAATMLGKFASPLLLSIISSYFGQETRKNDRFFFGLISF
jgi:hypothetical protein